MDFPLIANVDELRAALAGDPALQELVPCLEAIPKSVAALWTTNYQPWFTDHGPDHSRRVAGYAMDICQLPLLHPSMRLSPLESFVLWASAWLHDIGMQDLMDAGPLGGIDMAGYAHVRHQHPERSSENILANWRDLGLPADDHVLAELVANIARAHGTSFYQDTIETRLEKFASVKNQPVRGRLLAALLLFADELDMHYERTSALPGWAVNNTVSQAHAFKHKVVRGISPRCGADNQIGVEIQIDVPAHLNETDLISIQRWIEIKLRRQMAMVEPAVIEGFEGQVRFNRAINVTLRTVRAAIQVPDSAALTFIRSEVERDQLINHRDERDALIAAMKDPQFVALASEVHSDSTSSLDDGRADILAVVHAWGRAHDFAVHSSQRARLSMGATRADVAEEWLHSLCLETPVMPTDPKFSDAAVELIVAHLSATPEVEFLFTVDAAEYLDGESLTWLAQAAWPRFRATGRCRLVAAVAGQDEQAILVGGGALIVTMGELASSVVEEYLSRYTEQLSARAGAASSPSYRQVRLLAQQYELLLAGEGGSHAAK